MFCCLKDGISPRTEIGDKVYTSTEYPHKYVIQYILLRSFDLSTFAFNIFEIDTIWPLIMN